METSVITTKGQVVIPIKIRKKFGMKGGTKVAFLEKDGRIIVQPLDKDYFDKMAGILGEKGRMLKSLMDDKKKEREL